MEFITAIKKVTNPFSFIKIFFSCSFIFVITHSHAQINADTTPISSKAQAIAFIKNIKNLQRSKFWINVQPESFLDNLKENIYSPLKMYEGSNTNFCGYAALSYLPLNYNPLGFAKFMVELYSMGKAKLGKAYFIPSSAIKLAAGTLKFKGILDIHPADQIWFLSLADHFKGYVNFFNKSYDPGDENTFWAAVNYAKFNRMIKNLFNYNVHAVGSDLIRPKIEDLYRYISDKMKTGTVALYLNNANLYRKKYTTIPLSIPTHFVFCSI